MKRKGGRGRGGEKRKRIREATLIAVMRIEGVKGKKKTREKLVSTT